MDAVISYDGRHRSFTPGAPVGTMQTKANGLVLIGSAPVLAMKLRWVSEEGVGERLAAATRRPASVSSSTCMYTSFTSSSGRLRSTGGLTMAWLTNETYSCTRAYQRRAFSSYGS